MAETEQNEKDYESSKRVLSFIPSSRIEYLDLVDRENGLLCTVCISHNILLYFNKNKHLSDIHV